MNNIHEVRWRVLREQLRIVYRQAQRHESLTCSGGRLPDELSVEVLLRLAGRRWRYSNGIA